ncbi:MAG: hypothetical protein KDA88_04305 [Planctomycetaceae bacterium]|nr:hypothetical protein [Planctomycetaceae bacterium]
MLYQGMSPTLYGILADIVAVLHILYAGSIVVGLFLILIGGARDGWLGRSRTLVRVANDVES